MSVLTFASAIARVFCGLDTTTRATRPSSSLAIACVLPVASSATSSLGARLSANARSPSGVAAICPAWRTSPSCQIATCANSRCTSSPKHLRVTASPPAATNMEGDGRANDTYGFALAAHPGKSQGRPPTNTGSKPIEQDRPARPRLLPDAPVPDGRTVLTNPDVQDIEAVAGHRRHLAVSYGIPTRSSASTARSARRSRPAGTSPTSSRHQAHLPRHRARRDQMAISPRLDTRSTSTQDPRRRQIPRLPMNPVTPASHTDR